jgi:hypothetical protein
VKEAQAVMPFMILRNGDLRRCLSNNHRQPNKIHKELIMTADVLMLTVGVVLSLLFSYIPFIANWYYAFDDNKKKLIMLGFILAVSGGLFGLSCAGWASKLGITVFACTQEGLWEFVKIFFTVAIANQATAKLSWQPVVRKDSPEVL